jgi:hypothetical protein
MSQGGALRNRDVGAYLGISHHEPIRCSTKAKLPEPERVDGIGPRWKPATIERWAEREWWGSPAVAHIETERRL